MAEQMLMPFKTMVTDKPLNLRPHLQRTNDDRDV